MVIVDDNDHEFIKFNVNESVHNWIFFNWI